MPVAYHAISFRDTRSLIAIASFEKQELADEAARSKLRDTLIGPKMPVGVAKTAISGKSSIFGIAPSYLAIDALSEQPPRAALTSPLGFKVDLAATGEVIAGDGRDKILTQASLYTLSAIAVLSGTSTLAIDFNEALPRPPAGKLPAWVLFHDLLPISGALVASKPKRIAFPLPSTVASSEPFLLFVQDSPVISGVVP